MSRYFAPTTVSAALSGFVLGIIITLLAVGALSRGGSNANAPSTIPPATPVSYVQLRARIARIVLRQLGPSYPAGGGSRLIAPLYLQAPEETAYPPSVHPQMQSRYRSVIIRFRLNDNPLPARIWRLRTARAEVFAVMKALYTSQLPIYNVEMDGYFALPQRKGPPKLSLALVAYLDHQAAERIPWKRWTRLDEARLWSSLTYAWYDRRFA